MSRTIVILGAGPAGLTAALEMLRNNKNDSVYVLEAEQSVGGLAKTIHWKRNRFDIGGHRYFTHNRSVADWWNDIMPMKVIERRSSIYFQGGYIDYPVRLSKHTMRQLRASTVLRILLSYLLAKISRKQIKSLEDFYISRFGEHLYRLFFHDYTLKVWGKEPSDISSDWGPERIEGISLWKTIASIVTGYSREKSMTSQFYYPPDGCGSFWEKVAGEIQRLGGHIITQCEIRQIISRQNRIDEIICSTPNGELSIRGDLFFSSIPIRDLCERMTNTPKDILRIARGLQYRDMIVISVLIEKAACANAGGDISLRPEQWIYVQSPEVGFGRIQIINNWSETMVNQYEDHVLIVLEYFCQEGDRLWNTETTDWKNGIADDLKALAMIREGSDILDYHVCKVKKAYPCYWNGYYDMGKIENHLKKIENLKLIGRNGTHCYSNMDQVILNSIQAVQAL